MADFDAEDEYLENGPPGPDRGVKTKRLLLDFLGRWYWIALGLILGVLASAYYLSKVPKKYSATSTLLIKQQTSSVMSRDQIDEIDMRSIEGLNTVAERIRRFELLERVASRMDVRSLPGLIPAPVDWRPGWLAAWFDSRKQDLPVEKSAENAPPAPAALGGWMASWMNVTIRRGTRLQESNVNRQGEESSVDVHSFARVPGAPTSPQPTKIFATGGAAGLGLGLAFAFAFLLIRLDNKLHFVAQAEEETGLPVLAAVHRVFGLSRSKQGPGVTEWLAGQACFEDVILRDVGADNLHIILSGKRAPNPGELLNVNRTLELLGTDGNPPAGIVFNGFKESRRMIGQNYSYGSYRLSRYGKAYQYGYGSYGACGAYGSDDADDEDENEIRKRKRNSRRKA